MYPPRSRADPVILVPARATTMIGLPLYRLLVALVLVLSSAAATTRLGHAEPKTACESGTQAGACSPTAEPR